MIDWLTLVAALPHDELISAGRVLSITPSGEVEWQSVRRATVSGSFSTGLTVRSCTHTADPCTHVEISGNPVKFFQGHNLWGTDDLPALAVATLEQVAQCLGVVVSDETRCTWLSGEVQLTRVDCTESFHLSSIAEVLAWLRSAEQTAHLSHRGRGQLVKGSTLYFGKNSRRWSLKLYAKGQEIRAKGHGQDSILNLPHAMAWADRTLRAELTLRSLELKRRELSFVRDWFPVDGVPSVVTSELLRASLGSMTMTTTAHLSPDVVQTLRPALRAAVAAWEAGHDLRGMFSRSAFYKFRGELLPLGIDIATLQPREVSNVVPLYRVLQAVPVSVPDWAVGTDLYFEPRRVA
jgi:II/X family phage/plasmid replication protein